MSLTRKDLQAMDIPAEKIDVIINGHTETVNALKEERDKYKEKAEKADSLQKELDKAKETIEGFGKDDYKTKYDTLNKEYKDYKKAVDNEKSRAAKEKAFTEVLKDIGITDEKHIAKVLKYSKVDDMEIDDDGKLVDAKDVAKEVKSEWAELITTKEEKGASVAHPEKNEGGSPKTKEDILAIKDTSERQKAMKEHADLFGLA